MVNVITGDLVNHEVDLVIPGPNPIIIERSYSSSFDEYGSLEYEWDLNHSMRLNTSYDDKTFFEKGDNFIFHFKANLKEGQGAITQFEGIRGNNKASLTQTCIDQGMTNCGKGEISGKTNPKNRYALQKNKERVEENWLLVDGTGTTHLFTGKLRVEGRNLELAKTTFPNGNHFSYRYDKKRILLIASCALRKAGF
jgi:hypothetical protein